MKSEVNIAKGPSFSSKLKDGSEITVCLGNTSGYVINREIKCFQLIFMTGAMSPFIKLEDHIEELLKNYYK